MEKVVHKDDCFNLGYISSLHGFRGEFKLYLDVDDPAEYEELESVYVELDHKLVPFSFTRFSRPKQGFVVAGFEGVDSEEQAKKLVGKSVYLPLEALPPLSGNKFYYHEVIGFSVHDAQLGEVGEVKDVLTGAAQHLLQVFKGKTEILIPILDNMIVSVDRPARVIHTSVPEGLVEMYTNPDKNEDRDV